MTTLLKSHLVNAFWKFCVGAEADADAVVADEADDSALLLLALAPEPSVTGSCNKERDLKP